jgi:uncharacterized DUF497 family protein
VEFRWNEWNLEHIARHGVKAHEAERVIESAHPPYPEERDDEKLLVIGRGAGERWLQVIFVLDGDGTVFVIHARPLDDREKRRYRRRMRR